MRAASLPYPRLGKSIFIVQGQFSIISAVSNSQKKNKLAKSKLAFTWVDPEDRACPAPPGVFPSAPHDARLYRVRHYLELQMIGHFFTEIHHSSGEIFHYLCIFNKLKKKTSWNLCCNSHYRKPEPEAHAIKRRLREPF